MNFHKLDKPQKIDYIKYLLSVEKIRDLTDREKKVLEEERDLYEDYL